MKSLGSYGVINLSMEEVYAIIRYLPLRVSDSTLSTYIDHHLSQLYKCVEHELFSSAFFHLHILYMIFVYVHLFRISSEKKHEFVLSWIGFPQQERNFFKKPFGPLAFSLVNEKTVLRFFRLVEFDDGVIGELSAPIDKRNSHMHASGEILLKDEDEFRRELDSYLSKMKRIVEKQADFLNSIYTQISSGFEPDYIITQDDVESSLAIPYYFSEYELEFCARGKSDLLSKHILNT